MAEKEVRSYRVGQVLFRYNVDRFSVSDPEKSELQRWTVSKVGRLKGFARVEVTCSNHSDVKFTPGESWNWLEAELETTEHAAYEAAVRRLKAAVKRLQKTLKDVEKKAKRTGRKSKAAPAPAEG